MRASPHGAKQVPIRRPRRESPGALRPAEVADRGWPRRIVGMRVAVLLAAGICGCGSMSGNLNNQVGSNGAPPTMFASNFGETSVVAYPFPSAPTAFVQMPLPAQTALAPSQTNDDPAHIAN